MSSVPICIKVRESDPGEPPDTGEGKKEEDAGVGVAKALKEPKALSFKEKLMQMGGALIRRSEEEEELPENKWYKFKEEEEAYNKSSYVYDPCPEIRVSDAELADWSEPWKEALVVTLMGKKVSFRVLENKLNRDWGRKGSLKITDLPKNFYVVQFTSTEDYLHALFNGPWMLADHYLLVQRWRPFFITNATIESKVAVWVRIPELPLEFYNDRFLWRVGAKLGSLLKIDRLTSIQSRGQFARICVEIDLSKKLVPTIKVMGAVMRLEYEGLHVVCFACGRYGHKQDSCPELQKQAAMEEKQEAVGGEDPVWEEKDPMDKEGGKGPEGTGEKKSLTEVAVLAGDKGSVDHAESDQYSWLTVKKVKRQRPANREAGGSEKLQIPKKVMMGEGGPTPKVKGSRFSLLTEGIEQVSMELDTNKEEGVALKESNVVVIDGLNQPNMGQQVSIGPEKVRSVKGGKNPQGVNKGKENKPAKRPLGPRTKQFSTKSIKKAKEMVQIPVRVKGSLHLGKTRDQFLNPIGSLREDSISREKDSQMLGASGNEEIPATKARKEEMDWKGEGCYGDSDVLRDLHLGIQNFNQKIVSGEEGSKKTVLRSIEDIDLQVSGDDGNQGVSPELVCLGSVSTQPQRCVS